MPERPTRRPALRTLGKGIALLLLAYLAYTELRPIGERSGSVSLECSGAVEQYADAVVVYWEAKGRLPHSLDQLVPIYLAEHRECAGSFTGVRPVTQFGIVSTLRSILDGSPPARRPDYSLVQLPGGAQSFEIICARRHSVRTGYRGDTGTFVVDERATVLYAKE